MLQAMILAHLLGDYVFQTDIIARWKSKSLWGVAVHGAIATLCLWVCSLPFTLDWWPYALVIGTIHTLVDIIRVKIGKTSSFMALVLLLADQTVHILSIVLGLRYAGWLGPRTAETALGIWLQADNRLWFVTGYALLTMPAWVLVHFVVQSMGAHSTSLPGRPGERYVGMIERGLIVTFVLLGEYFLVPLVLAPRLALDSAQCKVEGKQIGYLDELLFSMGLAVVVGLFLRGLI